MDGGSAAAIDLKGNNFSSFRSVLGEGCALGSTLGRLLLRSCWRTSCIVLTGSCHMAQEDIGTTEVFGLTVHRKEKLLLSQTRNRTVVLLFRLMQSKRSIQYVYMHECTVSTYKLTDIPVSNSIYMHESTPCMDKLNLCTIYMSRFYTHMQDL